MRLLSTLLIWLLVSALTPSAVARDDDSPALTAGASLLATVPVPTLAQVQSRLDALAARKLPEADQSAARQALERTLENLRETQDKARQLTELKRLVADAPEEIERLRSELRRLEGQPAAVPRFGAGDDPVELEKAFSERNEQIEDLRRSLAEANSMIIGARTDPSRTETRISAGQARIAVIGSALRSGQDAGGTLTPERRDQLASELGSLEAADALRQARLKSNEVLQGLGQARRDLLLRKIAQQEAGLGALQTAINEQRREKSAQTVAELSAELRASQKLPGTGGLLARETEVNRKLSEFLLRTTDRLNDLTQRNLKTRQQLDALNQTDKNLEEQISVLQGSLLLTRILYQQKQALPRLQLDDKLADQIGNLRLYQFEINQHREQLADPAAYAEQLLAQQPGTEDAESLRKALLVLLQARADLLADLNRELGLLLNESFSLQMNQRQLQATADKLRATLDEQMFWVPSNRPLDRDWLVAAPALLARQLDAIAWGEILHQALEGFKARPVVSLLALIVPAGLLLRRRRLREKLAQLHQEVVGSSDASPWHTPLAVLLELLRVLPAPALLALAGLALQLDARGYNPNLGAALIEMAVAWLVFGAALRILAPDGVATLHFRWSAPAMVFLRRRLRWAGVMVVVLAAVVTIADYQPAALADDVLGILIVLIAYALLAWLMGQLGVAGPRGRGSVWRLVANLFFGLLPLLLIGALVLGYYYTALKLTGRLIDSLYVIFIWRLLQAMSIRWLSLASGRLARLQALRRRASESVAAARADLTGMPTLEPDAQPGTDINRINQQSLRIVHLVFFGLLLFGLYLVWADLIQVFSYLEKIKLYEYASGTGERAAMVPISLGDVLDAVVIVIAMLALARNLPGMLEVLVLSRIELAQGSAYAITTLVSYAIGIIGLVATLGTLGVSWSKLQWLVAALSVGLGFGLQEIFANFVSGLIILFERPVRIGDVVTIGEFSGTVSRIRTRATTITDFDRKEIIVPNKTFVTDKLINWSLSDTVTRVGISIGVAHGSDLELVRQLLFQAARENPRVLTDPAPIAYFKAFGVNTLDHELSVHVPTLGDRTKALDEINRRIEQLFREHGIDIAFRQVDVHLRNALGQELQLVPQPQRPESNPSAGPDPASPAG